MFRTILSAFRSLSRSGSPVAARQRQVFRPSFESLEDRMVPTGTITAATLASDVSALSSLIHIQQAQVCTDIQNFAHDAASVMATRTLTSAQLPILSDLANASTAAREGNLNAAVADLNNMFAALAKVPQTNTLLGNSTTVSNDLHSLVAAYSNLDTETTLLTELQQAQRALPTSSSNTSVAAAGSPLSNLVAEIVALEKAPTSSSNTSVLAGGNPFTASGPSYGVSFSTAYNDVGETSASAPSYDADYSLENSDTSGDVDGTPDLGGNYFS